MKQFTRRLFLGTAFALTAAALQPAEAILFSGAQIAAPTPPGTLIKTIQVANNTGSTIPADRHTQTFGLAFKKGDVASGTYPVLKTSGGTTIDVTFWNKKTWSDGSLKFIGCLARLPISISGSSSVDIKVYNGGSAPAAGNRTLSEVYAENFQANATNATDNATGTYIAPLQGANVLETVEYGNGPAGRIWRLLVNFTKSGTPHGQLVCYYYVMALQDASGNLAGTRILSRITMPWYDVDSPAKNWVGFESFNLQYGSSPTVYNPYSVYQTRNFTWLDGDSKAWCDSPGNGYDSYLAVRLTSTGTLPSPLATNTTYFMPVGSGAASNIVSFGTNPVAEGPNQGQIDLTDFGTGTHTIHPQAYVVPFCSQWIADSQGRYYYVQGAGSVSTDPNTRIIADRAYDRSTKIIPPYDPAYFGNVNSSDSYTWAPMAIANLWRGFASTGERGDLAILTASQAAHFFNQTMNDEKVVRIVGMAQGFIASCMKKSATLAPVNLGLSTYGTMGSPVSRSFAYAVSIPPYPYSNGFTTSGIQTFCYAMNLTGPDYSHQPNMSAYLYFMTAEPHAGDLVFEAFNMALISGDRDFTVNGTTYYNIGLAGKVQLRSGAWFYRDLIWAGVLMPDTNPDTGMSTQYVLDTCEDNGSYIVAWLADQNAWWQTSGYWYGQNVVTGRAPWQWGYQWQGINLHAFAMEDTNALAMAAHMSLWPQNVTSYTGNLWCMTSYYEITSPYSDQHTPPQLSSDLEWAPIALGGTSVDWTSSGSILTLVGSYWTLANGDKFLFRDTPDSPVIGGITPMVPVFAVNVSGNNFQVSLSKGGAPITLTDSGSGAINFGIVPQNPPSTGVPGGNIYGINLRACMLWAKAGGISGLTSGIAEYDSRLAGENYAGDQCRYAFSSSF